MKIESYSRNVSGHDYVVGDIHGCFSRLHIELDRIGFDVDRDRLFSVGDLVDRGPESHMALDWLNKPWFHAVRGNHEQMAIDASVGMCDRRTYAANGGQWFMDLPDLEQKRFAKAFAELPLVIEVETHGSLYEGLVGIVHANCPDNWADFPGLLNDDVFGMLTMWSRERVNQERRAHVAGVRAVVVGHTPLRQPVTLGNVLHIDTGAVFGHQFTILDLATLEPV